MFLGWRFERHLLILLSAALDSAKKPIKCSLFVFFVEACLLRRKYCMMEIRSINATLCFFLQLKTILFFLILIDQNMTFWHMFKIWSYFKEKAILGNLDSNFKSHVSHLVQKRIWGSHISTSGTTSRLIISPNQHLPCLHQRPDLCQSVCVQIAPSGCPVRTWGHHHQNQPGDSVGRMEPHHFCQFLIKHLYH